MRRKGAALSSSLILSPGKKNVENRIGHGDDEVDCSESLGG